jgi:uncharacterized repeat protein (TIGR03803 family)
METVLCSFPRTDGTNPGSALILDSAGNLYGTTATGGTMNFGSIYRVSNTGEESVPYSFTGGADGGGPSAGVVGDSAGNLYGTTYFGGTTNWGTVYKLSATGQESVLYNFTGGADGAQPTTALVLDPQGNLYGATAGGGASSYGVVYKVNPAGVETVLYTFTGGTDGGQPNSVLVRDGEGNLYGTANTGGASNQGVLFEVSSTGLETVLYSFTGGADGGRPTGVIRSPKGKLFGTASSGGASGSGVVFEFNAGALTVLHSFSPTEFFPTPGVTADSLGNLYGTTTYGGPEFCGIAYELDLAGNETVLHTFTNGTDGGRPSAGVIVDTEGNLYGTAMTGGQKNAGVVFKLEPAK